MFNEWLNLERISKHKVKHEKIFSISLFDAAKHSSRAFMKYFNEFLTVIIPAVNDYFKDWGIVLYLDYFLIFDDNNNRKNKVLNFIKENINNPLIDIYIYQMPKLITNKQHIGTSGTMVRFIPFFEKKYKVVWCLDVDLHPTYFKHMDIEVNKFINSKYKLYCGLNTYGYTWKERMPDVNNKYALVAGTLLSKISFPPEFINDFMKNVINRTVKGWDKLIDGAKKDGRRWRDGMDIFPYGGDEWFLNTYIYNYIQQNNIPVLIEMRLNPEGLITYLLYNTPQISKLINQKEKEYKRMRALEKEIWINQTPQNWAEYRKITISFTEWLLNNVNKIPNLKLKPKEKAYLQFIKQNNEFMKKSNNYYFIWGSDTL